MAFDKANVVVVYRENDDDSLDFANQYKSLRDLDEDQLIALPCSNIEILDNYAEFQSEIETPLLSALNSSPVSNYNVWAIVVAPHVPGGFRDGSDVISTTSRLSRINHVFNKNVNNPLYDRQVFSRFGSEDADISLICTRFDAPTLAIINEWIENLKQAKRQVFVTGSFYFDAFSDIGGNNAFQYTNELVLFSEILLPSLGLPIVSTEQIDPYIDSLIPSVEDDSFFWGWGADRGSLTFFKNTSHIRAFFYNADFDGAYTMRDLDERNWPIMAIRRGYVATAGALSNPGIDGFLRPRPFFDALFRGATLGEAFLFSQPYLDWTMACFGDPLMTFSFSQPSSTLDLITEDAAWQSMADSLSESIIRIYRKTNLIKELRDQIVLGDDVETSVDLAYPFNALYKAFQENGWQNDFVNLTNALISFALNRSRYKFSGYYPSFNDYLSLTENKITENVLKSTLNSNLITNISSNNIRDEGSWYVEIEIEHTISSFSYYHFEIDVATDENFDDIIISKKSYRNLDGWYYQDYDNEFKPLGQNGLTSSFAGRKIKYLSLSNEYLTRGEYYYIRFRQKDQSGFYGYKYITKLIDT